MINVGSVGDCECTGCLRVFPVSSWFLKNHSPLYPTHLPSFSFTFTGQCLPWERERESEAAGERVNKRQNYWNLATLPETTRPRMRLLRYNEDKQLSISSNLQASEPPALLVELRNVFLNVKCRWRYPYCNALCNSKYMTNTCACNSFLGMLPSHLVWWGIFPGGIPPYSKDWYTCMEPVWFHFAVCM